MTSASQQQYVYYNYNPSIAASCIFAVLFGISTIWHLGLLWQKRLWYFIPVIVGGIFEFAGYVARAVSHTQAVHQTEAPFVIQIIVLLVAPILFSASIYMVLGRIIVTMQAQHYSMIKTKWLTAVFVTSDVICFLIQAAGAGLMARGNRSTTNAGSHIVLVGLIVQIVIFCFFVLVAVVFHRRMNAKPTYIDLSLPWKKSVYVLYITSCLVLVRNIVRVVEFAQGFKGFIENHEVFLYVFDGVPMAALVFIYNVWYPSTLSGKARRDASMDDTAEKDTVSPARSMSVGDGRHAWIAPEEGRAQ
ncbi:hypothetical protein LTR10_005418 [Elasticomyces elasticus]|nr:hypothetical protein LTR10_005418 [Elasticomyces elasticus]KAK4976157.1 hypothetical protein LTR42_003782 [Elasticomyces elasticus]